MTTAALIATDGLTGPVSAGLPAPQGDRRPGHQTSRERGSHGGAASGDYYPLFDYLRITLAVGVFVAHADRTDLLPGSFGNLCVQVFFALSGFLIGGILVRNTIKDLPRFYYNRSTRIWVPYFLAIAVLFVGCLAKRQPWDGKLLEFFFYKVAFVYNTFGASQLSEFAGRMPLQGTGNHFWSICVEEQFYLVAPLVVVLWRRGRVAVLVLAWLVNFIYPHDFAAISLGVLLALSQKHYGDWFTRRPARRALLAVLGLSVVGTVADVVAYSVAAPVGSVCAVALLARRGRQRPLGQLLGGVSYPFYLNHWVGLVLRGPIEARLGLPPLAGTLVALAIALGFSTALYLLVDRRIQAYRSRWYSRRRGLWCCGAGAALAVVGLLGGLAFHLWPPR
jgi:peptidoglycan/LPS O-acetylase OafA/YrhL